MSDPLRTDAVHPPEGEAEGERATKIESLLLTGLDHYFAAEYDQAINLWTRVLFLDRGHTSARAYIERARGALAEQQRESDELLQNGVTAFQRGEAGTARRLLNSAVERGGAQDVALAFLARLNRLDAATGPGAGLAPVVMRRHIPGAGTTSGRETGGLWIGLFVVAMVAGALYALASWQRGGPWNLSLRPVPAAEVSAPHRIEDALPLPRMSEAALERARGLFASGRLRDALRAADLVRPADPLRQEADRLKTEIQRELLAPPVMEGGRVDPPPAAGR
jgi:hypothetical protein